MKIFKKLFEKNLIEIFLSYLLIITIILLVFFVINNYFLEYEFKDIKTESILTIVGGFIGGFFIYYRSVILEKQLVQKDEQYTQDSQFKNFLEATKMLTDKDSTLDAKISALYLLYDLAIAHPNNTERIIQVINQQIIFLIKIVNDDNYKNSLKKQEVIEWEYQGNESEKLAITALKIIKKISLLETITALEYYTSIIFAIDTRYDKVDSFIASLRNKEIPTKNLIFFHCIFDNVDFSEMTLHYCKFINCNLKESNFSNSNLWGTSFVNCNLEKTNFEETECEGVEIRNCFNVKEEQIKNQMIFKNKKENNLLQFLIVLPENKTKGLNLMEDSYFKTLEDYRTWKNIKRRE